MVPSLSATFTLTTRAPGAIPVNACAFPTGPDEPAMMPAMCVPCPMPSASALPSPDTSVPATSRAPKNGDGCTPVSTSATSTPAPV